MISASGSLALPQAHFDRKLGVRPLIGDRKILAVFWMAVRTSWFLISIVCIILLRSTVKLLGEVVAAPDKIAARPGELQK